MTNEKNTGITISSISIDKKETTFEGGVKINIKFDIPAQTHMTNINYEISQVVGREVANLALDMSCWAEDESKKETRYSKTENILRDYTVPAGAQYLTGENSFAFLLAQSKLPFVNIHVGALKDIFGEPINLPWFIFSFKFKIKSYVVDSGEFYTTPLSQAVEFTMRKNL